MEVFIYTSQTAHGIIVIVDNLVKAFQRKGVACSHITSLKDRSKDDIIIPYGIKEATEVIRKGFKPHIAFLADAISLGYLNKIKHYLCIGHVFNYDFWYSIYGYLRYSQSEKMVSNYYKYIILVSNLDIEYMKKKYTQSKCNYICAPNGAPSIGEIKPHVKSDFFRLGILSPWGTRQTFEESNWFVKHYFVKYHQEHPDVILKIAGRGSLSNRFKGLPGVEVIGEVDNLADFFANIDVFVSSNPKGCGILNRVLDAFMYRVPVLGHKASFSGFPNSDDICYKFKDYQSFNKAVSKIIGDPDEASKRVELATNYVLKHHDWERNYKELISKLDIFSV